MINHIFKLYFKSYSNKRLDIAFSQYWTRKGNALHRKFFGPL